MIALSVLLGLAAQGPAAAPAVADRLTCAGGGGDSHVELILPPGARRASGRVRRTEARVGLHSVRLLFTDAERLSWAGAYADSGPPPAHAAGYLAPKVLRWSQATGVERGRAVGGLDLGALILADEFRFDMEIRDGGRLWARLDYLSRGEQRHVEGDVSLGALRPDRFVLFCAVDDFVVEEFRLR